MKRILMTLMVLVMLTPSLACASFMCCVTEKQQQEQSQDMPCHKQEKQQPDVMFMTDCANIDLQAVADITFVKKQISQPHDLFVLTEYVLRSPANGVAAVGIRGPPRDIVLASSSPPVYLATLRLRI